MSELEPAIKTWPGDKLNRTIEGLWLRDYLNNRYKNNSDKSFVFNINSAWGFGKTFFINHLKTEFENKRHPVVKFNAWESDHFNLPLLPLIYEITHQLQLFFSKLKLSPPALKSIASLGKNLVVDIAQENFLTKVVLAAHKNTTENWWMEYSKQKENIANFKNDLRTLTNYVDGKGFIHLPIYVLIDELDRCRPNYAIELLENIKHLFDVPGLYFIIATDSEQLKNSVAAVYGEKFGSEDYLKRFFDMEYNLADPEFRSYSKYLLSERKLSHSDGPYNPLTKPDGEYSANELCFSAFSQYFNLSLRDQEQIANQYEAAILGSPNHKQYYLPFLLFLIMFRHTNSSLFSEFVETNELNPMYLENLHLKMYVDLYAGFSLPHAGSAGKSPAKTYKAINLVLLFLRYFDMPNAKINEALNKEKHEISKNVLNYLLLSKLDNKFIPPHKYVTVVKRIGRFET